jgi:predicted nucleotidyltransferase
MQEQARVSLDLPLPDERVFRYRAMQDILSQLVNNPFRQFTQKELATIIDADVSSVSRSVELLDQLGVLRIESGRPRRIGIDRDHLRGSSPLSTVPQEEFRQPIRTFIDELHSRVEANSVVETVVGVILFGSVARGTADRSSDIDLLVILDGDATYARRVGTRTARKLEERRFDGDRYRFEVLVETPETASSRGAKLKEIFDEGIVLEPSDELERIRDTVYGIEREGGT